MIGHICSVLENHTTSQVTKRAMVKNRTFTLTMTTVSNCRYRTARRWCLRPVGVDDISAEAKEVRQWH